jgi:glyoxylase-like metal-dependent hydrolase (beta-lactamase superfamily II)
MPDHPVHLNAGNGGPFTLDGTRTFLVGGSGRMVVLDPGPDVEDHVRAVVSAAGSADSVAVLLTHGHPDHAGAARAVADALEAPILGPAEADVDVVLEDGAIVETGRGHLVAVHTPGHTRGHLCFQWPAHGALFAGDHLLGEGDTTWVAEYPGCVADYLASLEMLRGLTLRIVYPAHGPPLEDPVAALDRFERHRRARIGQVRDALEDHPGASAEELLVPVYGQELPSAVRPAAVRSLEALVEYVEEHPGDG